MVGDPQREAQSALRIPCLTAGRSLDRRVELQQILERRLELGNRPAPRLSRELLDPERVESERPRQGFLSGAGREQVADLQKLADPAVKYGQ